MNQMPIIDFHCDTLMECVKGVPLAKNSLHIDLEKLKKGGAMAQFFAIFIPTGECAAECGVTLPPYEYFQQTYAAYCRELEQNSAEIAPALCYGDILKNREAGKLSAILTIEDGGAVLDGQLERLEEAWEKGVRLITLTWSYENCVGYPASAALPELMDKGLKPFGMEVLHRMEELGMIVDVSHLSDGGFWDVVKLAGKPFVASHSCCRTFSKHPRALTDDMLRAIGDKGGLVGVNFCDAFLVEGGVDPVQPEDVVRHLRHMANVAGMDTPAFGSDFDGITSHLAFENYAGMPRILAEMERQGFTPAEIDKICHGNALRVIRDTMG